MKIAIIGGTGSIGTHVARELSRNHEVIICDIVRPRLMDMENGIMFCHCDVLDSNSCNDALQDIDVVFHKVGLMGGVRSLENPNGYYELNVIGTLNVLNACGKSNVEKIIFDSSTCVFGKRDEGVLIEDRIPHPSAVYGASKYIAEGYIRLFCEKNGLDFIIFRYPRIIADDNSTVLRVLTEKILNDELIEIIDDGENAFDLVRMEDVVRAHALALNPEVRNDFFHISTGEHITVNALISEIARIIGRKRSEIKTSFISKKGKHIVEADTLPKVSCLDITNAREKLGFEPSISLKECIRVTVQAIIDTRRT